MRPIKFRQRTKSGWHYWGWLHELGQDVFTGPLNPQDPSYQFTGLHDKNGKECFEGDRVKNSLTKHKGIVRWDREACCFCAVDKKGKWACSMGAFNSDGFIIEGCENLELLEIR